MESADMNIFGGLSAGATSGRWLVASILLAAGPARAQEALRNSLAGQAAAEGRHRQLESQPYSLKAGDFRLLIAPSLGIEWNDNVNTAKGNSQEDFILRPLLRLNASYPLTHYNLLNLSVGVGYDKYLRHDQYSVWSLQSGSELAFDLYIKDVWISLHDRVEYVQDSAQEAAIAGTAQYGAINNTAGLLITWDLEDVTLSLGYDHESVISSTGQFKAQNGAAESIVGRTGLRLHPRFTVGVEATGSFTTYEQTVLNHNAAYSAGVYADWQPGSFFRIQPRVGYLRYQFQQTSQFIRTSDLNSWYAHLAVTHQVSDAVSYSLSAGHEVRLGIQSDAIEDWYVRPSIDWGIVKNAPLKTFLSYEHGKQGAGNRAGNLAERYDWFGAGLGVSYALMKKLTLSLNYRRTLRSSDDSSREYVQNLVGLQLTYQFK